MFWSGGESSQTVCRSHPRVLYLPSVNPSINCNLILRSMFDPNKLGSKKYKDIIHVNKYPKQGSGMISSIAYSDGIIEIPEDVSQINKGDKFKLYLFSDLFD